MKKNFAKEYAIILICLVLKYISIIFIINEAMRYLHALYTELCKTCPMPGLVPYWGISIAAAVLGYCCFRLSSTPHTLRMHHESMMALRDKVGKDLEEIKTIQEKMNARMDPHAVKN